MVKLVLMHKADSIYDDEPDKVYDFPRSYLKAVSEAVDDWIIYYEPVKAGPRGYFAVAKIGEVIAKPGVEGRYLALIEPGTSFLSTGPFQGCKGVVRWRRHWPSRMDHPKRAARCSWLCVVCRRGILPAFWISACRRNWNRSRRRNTIRTLLICRIKRPCFAGPFWSD